jgi:hypothetical protein
MTALIMYPLKESLVTSSLFGKALGGDRIFHNAFALSIEFVSIMSGASWVLTNVDAPCTSQGRQEFLDLFGNIDMANCWEF